MNTFLHIHVNPLHLQRYDNYSNKRHGILAWGSCKVIIHLPSHHNTFYNNRQGDRYTTSGGTITNVED